MDGTAGRKYSNLGNFHPQPGRHDSGALPAFYPVQHAVLQNGLYLGWNFDLPDPVFSSPYEYNQKTKLHYQVVAADIQQEVMH